MVAAALAALAAFAVWIATPMDLVPSWLTVGSYDRSKQALVPHVTVPDGFVCDLVGMPLGDAKRQLQQHGLTATVSNFSFGPRNSLLISNADGVSLTVFLGRVVKAERPASI